MSDNKNLPATIDASAGMFLEKFSKSLGGYAVRQYDITAFLKSAMIAIVSNKDLSKCLNSEKGKLSLFNTLRYAAATGLSLNPQIGEAALIGYENKQGEIILNYQIMKNGLIRLVLENDTVESIQSDYVKENDIWIPKKTASGDDYEFAPARKDRGNYEGFFASMKLKNGSTYVKWMTLEEVKAHRDKYSGMYNSKNKENSPWVKSFEGMAIKTVIKMLIKSVHVSKTLTQIIEYDDFSSDDYIDTPGISADETLKKLEGKEAKKTETKKTETKGGDLL